MNKNERHMQLIFDSCPENESFARGAAAAFLMPLDPTVDELLEIRTAVSEAVSNSVIHGYCGGDGLITMICDADCSGHVSICVRDEGCGIADVKQAREPLFSTKKEGERSGMGFTVMESFMDTVSVRSTLGKGTEVWMTKKLEVRYEQ